MALAPVSAQSLSLPTLPQAPAPPDAPGKASFGEVLSQIMQPVTQAQHNADTAVAEMAMGRTDQMHQVMLEVAKADLAFRLMLEIRNRLTEAVQEIMRMQV